MAIMKFAVPLAVVILASLLGCGSSPPDAAVRPPPAAAPSGIKKTEGSSQDAIHLSVSMPVASQFPNSDELAKRNQIIDELKRQGVGEFGGAGGGFGEMDFSFNVKDEAAAREMIADVVNKHLPGVAVKIVRIDD
jgi:hypothetical protein